MSRIGQKPVAIPEGVTVTVKGDTVHVKGPKGELSFRFPETISAQVDGATLTVSRSEETRRGRSFHGLSRTLVANMVEGVSQGFQKELEIQGVGFKAAVQGNQLILSLGFASPVEFAIPEGIDVREEGGTKVFISGASKELVGTTAARIRGFFPAEPYKGKGIRYRDEQVRRKVGKTVA